MFSCLSCFYLSYTLPICGLFYLVLLASTLSRYSLFCADGTLNPFHSLIQWKTTAITPVPKTKQPTQRSDFRPISVTPILSRLLEKIVVRNYIYPILTHPATHHLFLDLFAFRPTGSTTSAIVHLTHRLLAGAVSVTWFALGVQAPNYIFVIREQYQTKPDICKSLILKKILFFSFAMLYHGVMTTYVLLFC